MKNATPDVLSYKYKKQVCLVTKWENLKSLWKKGLNENPFSSQRRKTSIDYLRNFVVIEVRWHQVVDLES